MIDYILSFLCDDDEQLEVIIDMLNGGEEDGSTNYRYYCGETTAKPKNGEQNVQTEEKYNLENVLPVILKLFNEGKIKISYPYNTEKIDMEQLNEYWFSITKSGREFFKENEKNQSW